MANQDPDKIFSALSSDSDMLELVEEFVDALQERVNTLESAAGADNLQALITIAHQLKGASGGYGFDPIGEAAAVLESAGKQAESVNEIRDQLDALTGLCRRATAAPPIES